MQQRFQLASPFRRVEHDLAQPASVEAALGVQHTRAEGSHDVGQGGLAGLDDLARDLVRVHHRYA